MRLLILLPFMLLCLYSCGNEVSEETQQKNFTTITIGDISSLDNFDYELVDVIVLDTGYHPGTVDDVNTMRAKYGNSKMENIQIVQPLDSVIVVWETHSQGIGSLLFFNREGRFLKKIIRGKGPNELVNVQALIVSPSRKIFAILESSTIIKEFNLDGEIINTIRLPYSVNAIDYCEESSFVIKPSGYIALPFRLYYCTTDTIIPYPLGSITDSRMIDIGEKKNIFRDKERNLYFTDILTDTVYKISGSKLDREYVIDFGEHGLSGINYSSKEFRTNTLDYLSERKIFFQQNWMDIIGSDLFFFASKGNEAFVFKADLINNSVSYSGVYKTTVAGIELPLWKYKGSCDDGLIFSQNPITMKDLAISGKLDGIISNETKEKLLQLTELSNYVQVIVR